MKAKQCLLTIMFVKNVFVGRGGKKEKLSKATKVGKKSGQTTKNNVTRRKLRKN